MRDIALDPSRPSWQRCRAADAWVNGGDDRNSGLRELLAAIASEGSSSGHAGLHLHIAVSLAPHNLTTAEIRSVIAEVAQTEAEGLYELKRMLLDSPPADLFDDPASEWLGTTDISYLSHPVTTLIDELVAALIDTTPELSATRLWKWVTGIRDNQWSQMPPNLQRALRDWINKEAVREVGLFEAILVTDDVSLGASVVADSYKRYSGKAPSLPLVQCVLEKAATANSGEERKRFLLHAMALVRDPDAGTEAFWDTYDAIEAFGLPELLPALTVRELSPYHFSGALRRIKESRDAQKARTENISQLLPRLDDLRSGTHFGTLYWAAGKYLESRASNDDLPIGLDGIVRLTDEAITKAIVQGWECLLVNATTTTTADLGTAEKGGTIYNSEVVSIAALDNLHEAHRISQIVALPIMPIVALRSASLLKNTARRGRLYEWAGRRLNEMGEAGVTELLTFWNAALDVGATSLTGAWELLDDASPVPVAMEALQRLLSTRRTFSPEALWSAVRLLVMVSPRELVVEIATRALSDGATPPEVRGVWSFVMLMLEPALKTSLFAAQWPAEQIASLFERALESELCDRLNRVSAERRTEREVATIVLLGGITSPKDEHVGGRVMRPARLSDAVRSAANWLASRKDPEAGRALVALLDTANLAQWRPTLLHAWSMHSRARRDADFKHSPIGVIRAALAAGPPVNGADLRAIVVEVLRDMARELHTSSTTPWKRYWNTDKDGAVTEPRIENQCRDHVLERLSDRVKSYGIAIAIPEAQLSESGRADMLVATGAGRSLPVEVKRHFHPRLWTAASTQLQDYVTHESCDGFAVYLVLWFGVSGSERRLPLRPSGKTQPSTVADLESALAEDLPDEIRWRTDVIVFDAAEHA